MSKYLKILEQIQADAIRKQDNLIAAVRAELLVPYCNRAGLRFTAGMGSWSFDKPNRYGSTDWFSYNEPPPRIPKTLLAFLRQHAIDCNNDLGSLMQDYTPPNYRQSP